MILVDTSVWVDHLRAGDKALAGLLDTAAVLAHAFVIGELALGGLQKRGAVLRALQDLPKATVATDEEVMNLIDRHKLFGAGIGYVDAHLIAAVRLTPGAALWTRDSRLLSVAAGMGLAKK